MRARILKIIFVAIPFIGIIGWLIFAHLHVSGSRSTYGNSADSHASSLNSSNSAASFDPTAWQFADLIRDGTLYPVTHVIDGDTLVAGVDGHDVTVRLIGMDTPETVDPRKPVECFGPQASAEAKRIFGVSENGYVTSGESSTQMYLEKDPLVGDYDKYGRTLAYVRLPAGAGPPDIAAIPGGLFYNEYMLQKGFAREYTYMKGAYKYQADFKSDQSAAKAAKLGVWNKTVCPKPFSY